MPFEEYFRGIGRRIQELRKAKGISQTQLAALLEIKVENMNRMEGGQNICAETTLKLCNALDVSPTEFYAGIPYRKMGL